jgi:hypothetical protein
MGIVGSTGSIAWFATSGGSDSLSIAGGIGNGNAGHGIVKEGLGR